MLGLRPSNDVPKILIVLTVPDALYPVPPFIIVAEYVVLFLVISNVAAEPAPVTLVPLIAEYVAVPFVQLTPAFNLDQYDEDPLGS